MCLFNEFSVRNGQPHSFKVDDVYPNGRIVFWLSVNHWASASTQIHAEVQTFWHEVI